MGIIGSLWGRLTSSGSALAVDDPESTNRQGQADDLWGGGFTGRTVETAANIGRATPATIAQALVQADAGDPLLLFDLIQETTDRSTSINSALGTRKRAVAQLPWAIEPVDQTPAAAEVAETVRSIVAQIPNLTTSFVDLLASIENGYAATEIVWAVKAGQLVPARLEYTPSRFFLPSKADPSIWHLRDSADILNGVPLNPGQWIQHKAHAKPGFDVQSGLGRVFLWWFLFGHYGIKDWMGYSEMYGSPLRLGKYPAGSDSAQKNLLAKALNQLGLDSWAAVPKEMEIEFVGDGSFKSGPAIYQKLIDLSNKSITKLILGQTLTTESDASGSQALGNVHNQVRLDLVSSDAEQLSESVTRDLISAIVAFNLPPGTPVPHFRLLTEQLKADTPTEKKARAEYQAARLDTFIKAAQAGIPVSLDQMRTETGLSAPADAADTLTLTTDTPA